MKKTIRTLGCLLGLVLLESRGAAPAPRGSGSHAEHVPTTLLSDPRVNLAIGPELLVIEDGLQPSLLITRAGTLIVQSQTSNPSVRSKRQASHWAMKTVLSRDDGATWTELPLKPGENGLNLEGGGIQLRDGTLLALDTFVVKATEPGRGLGQL